MIRAELQEGVWHNKPVYSLQITDTEANQTHIFDWMPDISPQAMAKGLRDFADRLDRPHSQDEGE